MLGRVVVMAAIAMVAALLLPHLLDGHWQRRDVTPAHVAAATQPSAAPGDRPGRVVLEASRDGHFRTTAYVDGRALDILVDTGATLVTLRSEDAGALGLLDAVAGADVQVSTANGVMTARRVTLARLRIGDIVLDGVDALVAPPGALRENLLGMSALGRLGRFAVEDGRLVLEN